MAKRKRIRLSQKERRKRQQQSQRQRLYWKRVKRIAKRERISTTGARIRYRTVIEYAKREGQSFAKAERQIIAPPPPVIREPPTAARWTGRAFAFNVGEVHPEIPALFAHETTVTATIEYEQPQRNITTTRLVSFDSGTVAAWSGDGSFGRNYYRAVREDYKDYLGVASLKSEDVAVYVTEFSA